MEEKKYLAHISPYGRKQTVEEHLEGTAALCGKFASAFGCREQGEALGLMHDVGKCSEEFQQRLLGGKIVDHATAGALECAKLDLLWAACCIIGHHGGLPDVGNPMDGNDSPTMIGRLRRACQNGGIPKYSLPFAPCKTTPPKGYEKDGITDSFLIRMLYSCLVDADYLDTEAFMLEAPSVRSKGESMTVLCDKLSEFIKPWFPPNNELNHLRCSVLKNCIRKGESNRGLYTLTVPTGGGKTIASLAFALNHAVKNGLDRIIYVIPYTSIIEQTAEVFRNVLGENNVLEHHSGSVIDAPEGASVQTQFNALAAENWDAPVIVTTAVRFFESLYSNRSSACRKLHNIANSVIIFDEAQLLPSAHLRPCVAAMSKLAANFRSTLVLCTATQPVLAPLFSQYAPKLSAEEICPDTKELYRALKRCVIDFAGKLSNEMLASRLEDAEQVLCIVNSRKAAQDIYRMLPSEGSFHLSTLLYPEHRRELLVEIRKRLSEGLPCRVVSTSLIEAGVDVDFPLVYREMSGLDSILQAAGRCNREGKRSVETSRTIVFESENPSPAMLGVNIGAAKEAIALNADVTTPEAIECYFRSFLDLSDKQHDVFDIVGAFENGIQGCMLPFKTAAESFRFINDASKTVYIPTKSNAADIAALKNGVRTKALFRRLGRFGVGIYEKHFNELIACGDIVLLEDEVAVLENTSLYDKNTGLSPESDKGKALFY